MKILRILTILILSLSLLLSSAAPASALSVDEFFSISYDAVFSKTQVAPGESFTLTVTGSAVCENDLTSPYDLASAAMVSGRIVAAGGGQPIILSSSYVLNINPLPKTAGESVSDAKTLTMRFPTGTPEGDYDITGEVIEGKVKAIVWLTVTDYLPSSQPLGTITVVSSDAGGAGGAAGGAVVPTPTPTPVVIPQSIDLSQSNLRDYLDKQGAALCQMRLSTEDKACGIVIAKGTAIAFPAGVSPAVNIEKADNPTPAAGQYKILGQVFQFGPSGATFNPPLNVTFKIDPATLPSGVTLNHLVVACWNEKTSAWENLATTFDAVSNSVTAGISHFSLYAVLDNSAPAKFVLSGLTVSPESPQTGDTVTVKVMVKNSGDLAGTYSAILTAGSITLANEKLALSAGESREAVFSFSLGAAGDYLLQIGDQSATLKVASITTPVATAQPSATPITTPQAAAFNLSALKVEPAEVASGKPVSVTVTAVNMGEAAGQFPVTLMLDKTEFQTVTVNLEPYQQQDITFNIPGPSSGMHSVSLDGLSAGFKVLPSKFSLSGVIVFAGVVGACLAVILVFFRRRHSAK